MRQPSPFACFLIAPLYTTIGMVSATCPTLVMDGGTTPWLSHAADAVAETLPNAQRRTIAGQPHNVDPQALAPVLIEFFTT